MSLNLMLPPSSDCQFEVDGPDGMIRSSQVEEEERIKPGDALDCIWTIRAPPNSKVSVTPHGHTIVMAPVSKVP